MDRRQVVTGALLMTGAWALIARPWTWEEAAEVSFTEMPELPPFRRLAGAGAVSGGGSVALLGIPDPNAPPRVEVAVDAASVLLGDWALGGPVPVSYFTDLRCPLCPEVEARLDALARTHPIALRTREFPIFGPASDRAARGVLAAGPQGAAFRQRLRRSPAPESDEALLAVAATLPGLDPGAFEAALDKRSRRHPACHRPCARPRAAAAGHTGAGAWAHGDRGHAAPAGARGRLARGICAGAPGLIHARPPGAASPKTTADFILPKKLPPEARLATNDVHTHLWTLPWCLRRLRRTGSRRGAARSGLNRCTGNFKVGLPRFRAT